MRTLRALLLFLCAIGSWAWGGLPVQVDARVEAAISASFRGEPGTPRPLTLLFTTEGEKSANIAAWHLELLDASGQPCLSWLGEARLTDGDGRIEIPWDGRDAFGQPLAVGFHRLRLRATLVPEGTYRMLGGNTPEARAFEMLRAPEREGVTQSDMDICVGQPPLPKMLPFRSLSTGTAPRQKLAPTTLESIAATNALPYTIYYGNLHSHTKHSDGGNPVATCGTGESVWSGTEGPTQAYTYMQNTAGGDFLLTSDHNHMYDGSTSTDASRNPDDSKALFESGLADASAYRASHPTFLALYGTEWGVISNGGHLNILNPDGLACWEYNGSGQLLSHYYTPKGDYPSLYTFMRGRNWVGMFSHPDSKQFGQYVYTEDGDEVMALLEVANTAAFSKVIDQSAPPSFYRESYWNQALVNGFHVAPASDQDNHCANWGMSYTNRSAVLLPTGASLSVDNFLAAVRARRVFATLDKGSQIVLQTSTGALMGERINNSGPLTLNVYFATSTPGRSAGRVQIFHGTPNTPTSLGSVAQLSDGVSTITITPTSGAHFYYAIITQDNGDKLWSAPIWVTQASGPVTATITAPASNQTIANSTSVDFAATAGTTNASITGTAWAFGDGASATGLSTSHVFTNATASPVTYSVTFTATDNTTATGVDTRLITVNPAGGLNTAPTITDIPDQNTPKNTPFTVNFTIGDTQTTPALLGVTAVSSNKTVIPDANLVLGGSAAARTLTVTPAPDQSGSSTITVTVTDEAGATAVDTFLVTVGTPPPVSGAQVIISQYYEGSSNNKWIELTNVGDATYDASASPLYLWLWSNPYSSSAGTYFGPYALTGTLAPGASIILKNKNVVLPSSTYLTGTPLNNTVLDNVINFNGDDVVYLSKVGSGGLAAYTPPNRTDVIGVADTATWMGNVGTSGSTSTASNWVKVFGMDRSYVRKATVLSPNPTWTSSEWQQVDSFQILAATPSAVDTADPTFTSRLGYHVYNKPPVISDIPEKIALANTTLGPIAFTVDDAYTGAASVTLTVASSNHELVLDDSIVLAGTGTDRTLTITPVYDQTGQAYITITATDPQGLTSKMTFLLMVNAEASTIASVTVAPDTFSLNVGETKAFTATVTGAGTFSTAVSWSADSGTISSTGSYTAPATGGVFTVTAKSVQDPTKTGTATVTVNEFPTIGAIADQVTPVSTPLVDLPFSIGDTETAADSLVVTAVSSNPAVIPDANLVLGGSGTSRALTITPLADVNAFSTITLTVKDAAGATASTSFEIAVGNPPVPELIITQYYEGLGYNKWIEITNVGNATYDTTAAKRIRYLGLWSNPNTTSTFQTVRIEGPIAPGATVLYKNDNTSANPPGPLPLAENMTNSEAAIVKNNVINFNGNDAVFISTSSSASSAGWDARVDAIGEFGWGAANPAADKSYVRSSAILNGNPTFTSAEWKIFTMTEVEVPSPAMSSQRLGYHFINRNAPTADNYEFAVDEDVEVPVTLTGADAEGSALTFAIQQAPLHGQLSGTAPDLLYTPDKDWNGVDTFTYTANDGELDSAPATVTITLNPVDDPPVARSDAYLAYEDRPLDVRAARGVLANDSDAEGSPLTATLIKPPAKGTLVFRPDGSFTFTPGPGSTSGTNTFTYQVSDGKLLSEIATVYINVNEVNHAPQAVNDAYTLAQDTRLDVSAAKGVLANDVDEEPDSMTARLLSAPAHGTLALAANGAFTYVPAPAYRGLDSFRYEAVDAWGTVGTAEVTLNVGAVNHAPTAQAQALSTAENTPLAIRLTGQDPDGDMLAFTVQVPPAHGTLSGTAPNLTYTPNSWYSGPDSFTFTAQDAGLASAPAMVTITVTSAANVPAALAQSFGTLAGKAFTQVFSTTGGKGTLSYSVVTAPAKGAVVLGANGAFTYTPASGASGTDAFVWKVRDAAGQEAFATATVYINTINIDGDDILDGADLALLVDAIGTSDLHFDLNGDGKVDDADLDILLAELMR